MKKIVLFFLYILFIIPVSTLGQNINSNNTIRRHFLIYYDISYPFYSKEEGRADLKNTMLSLFKNEGIDNFSNQYLLGNEKSNGIKFFDPKKDQVSFFYFGLNTAKISDLIRFQYDSKKNNEFYDTFLEQFIWKPERTWKQYKLNYPKSDISNYINKLWDIEKPEWGNGISLSNLIYPLGIDALKNSTYAEEYIVIILSDFLTGAEFGNKKDLELLKNTIKNQQKYASVLSKKNQLAGKFHKIDYFDYEFKAGYENGKQNLLGILGYKIRPNTGKRTPDDTWLFLDSDVSLNQNSYESNSFSLSPQDLKFAHNTDLEIDNVKFTLSDNNNNILNSEFLNYTKSFDKNNIPIYKFEETNLDLSTIYSFEDAKEKSPFLIDYTFYSKYALDKGSFLNFAYKVPSRNIQLNPTNFKTKTSIIIMTYVLPIISILAILLLLLFIARPKAIELEMEDTKLSDSFEEIEYHEKKEGKDIGRYILPYLRWDDTMNNHSFEIKGKVKQGIGIFKFLWRDIVKVKLVQEKCLSNFGIYIGDRNEDTLKKGLDQNLKLNVSKNGYFNITVDLQRIDDNFSFNKHSRFQFAIEVFYQHSFIFSKTIKSEKFGYNFYVGPDFGNVWVGIDPGTTGSCIATGADGFSNVFIPKNNEENDLIIPSVITFRPDIDNDRTRGALPYKDRVYLYGKLAEQFVQREKAKPFRSIKKMLGFNNLKEIHFTNNNNETTYNLSGKDLTSLLIKGVYNELKQSVLNSKPKEFLINGEYNPKRGVVAIPNNFTSNKIQDIVDSVKELKQFSEVRCIYEAEANLIYYLFGNKKIKANSKVLLFDMGGATINATVVSIETENKEDSELYVIDILGKLGYGIGGDTIDYIILKYLSKYLVSIYGIPFSFSFMQKNVQDKEKWAKTAFNIKLQIIENYKNKESKYLIDPVKLQNFINDYDNSQNKDFKDIIINMEDDIMEAFTKRDGEYPFFKEYFVQELLYKNIESVIHDIIDTCDVEIDHILFSGRSTVFPLIKETVIKSINQETKPIIHSESIDKLKSAVAIGACLYGMNERRIKLKTTTVNSWFGVKRKKDVSDFEFINLIDLGSEFIYKNGEIGKLFRRKNIVSDFGLDGGIVNFVQVMGSSPVDIFKNNEVHKYSTLIQARVKTKTEGVGIEVFEDDTITCEVKEKGSKLEKTYSTFIKDQEMGDANEEHYTWIV